MDKKERVHLNVRVTRVGERFSEREARSAFWEPLIDRILERQGEAPRTAPRPLIENLERRLKVILGRNLRAELIGYFTAQPFGHGRGGREPILVASGLPTKYHTLLPLVGLEFTNIGYGSLDLTLDITGIKNLVDLFDGNFDLFMMFMQTYLPTAFGASLSELNIPDEDFQFDICPTSSLLSAFAAPAGGRPAPTNTDRSYRMQAMWLLTNFSLVVPVLVALFIMYVAATQIARERDNVDALRRDLSSREEAFVKVVTDRSIELEKSQSELVKTLKAPSPQKSDKKN